LVALSTACDVITIIVFKTTEAVLINGDAKLAEKQQKAYVVVFMGCTASLLFCMEFIYARPDGESLEDFCSGFFWQTTRRFCHLTISVTALKDRIPDKSFPEAFSVASDMRRNHFRPESFCSPSRGDELAPQYCTADREERRGI